MPTILLKKSDTPGSVPGTANLTNLAGGVEVAVNTADKRVYSMTSASAVIELGTNPSSLTCSDVSATVLRSASATITNLIATSASITTLTNNPTFSAGTANGVLFLNGSKVATSGSALVFDGANLLIGQTTNAQNYRLVIKGSAGSADDLAFNSDATRSEIQSFNSKPLELNRQGNNVTIGSAGSGNLGIGTASPGQKLEVAGNILVNTSGNPYAEIKTSGSGNNPYLKLTADTNSWTFQGTFSNANDDLLVLYNATTLLDLDKNGNLGLGVTPSAWYTISTVFQSNGYAFEGRSGTPDYSAYWTNAYLNAAGSAFIYRSNGYASVYLQASGVHRWRTAASGTAGGTISFTETMTLDASGNLGVGTTSPNVGSWGRAITLQGPSNAAYEVTDGTVRTAVYASAASTGGMSIETNHPLVFSTNSTERARITSGGQALFGTTTENLSRWGRALFNYPCGTSNPVIGLQNSTTRAANNLYGIVFADNTDESNAAVYVRQTGTNNAADLLFGTNAGTGGAGLGAVTERGRFTAGGMLLVGKTNDYSLGTQPGYVIAGGLLSVSTDNTSSANNRNWSLLTNGYENGSFDFVSSSANNNWANDAYRMSVTRAGSTYNTTGTYGTLTSDERLKQDIADASSQWDDMKAIRFRKFRMKAEVAAEGDDAVVRLGVIAQEAAATSPNLVTHRVANENDIRVVPELEGQEVLGFKDSVLFWKAAKALQEAMARIESLEADVAALKASA